MCLKKILPAPKWLCWYDEAKMFVFAYEKFIKLKLTLNAFSPLRENHVNTTKELEFEAMFCHHCDDSLAGHRWQFSNISFPLSSCEYPSFDPQICLERRLPLLYQMLRERVRQQLWWMRQDYRNRFQGKDKFSRELWLAYFQQDLSYKEKHWHESCFQCSKCRTSLVDKQFGSKADRIYCGPCYDAQFASRCDACGDVFKAGTNQKFCHTF